ASLRTESVSLLIVEQFVGQALEVADRAYVLEKGRITYAGNARQLATDDDFVKSSYLGDVEAESLAGNGHRDGFAFDGDEMSLPAELLKGIEERAEEEGVNPAEIVMRMLNEAFQQTGSTGNGDTKRGDD